VKSEARELLRVSKELLAKPSPVDLGWSNEWRTTPAIVERCQRLKHRTSDADIGPPNRGLEHVVHCPICNYVYRYDSSD